MYENWIEQDGRKFLSPDQDFKAHFRRPHYIGLYENWTVKGGIKLDQIKDSPYGLRTLAYFVPRSLVKLIKNVQYLPSDERKKLLLMKYTDIEEKDDEPCLITPLDLTKKDIPMLLETKKLVIAKLQTSYGVDPSKDEIYMFFHLNFNEISPGLHLHVRVNEKLHPYEISKSFSLEGVIKSLEVCGSVLPLVLDRSKRLDGLLHLSYPESYIKLMKEEDTQVTIEEGVINPFYIPLTGDKPSLKIEKKRKV